MPRPRFSQLLLNDKVITEEQLELALKTQAISGGLIGSILYSRKILNEEQVVRYLSKVYEIPGILVSCAMPNPQLKETIPEEIALKHLILPIHLENKLLTIAAANPLDLKMIQEVEFMSGCRLKVHVAMLTTLKDRISFYYGAGFQTEISLSPGLDPGKMNVTSVADEVNEVEAELLTRSPQEALQQIHNPLPKVALDWKEIQKRATTVLVVDDDASIRTLLQNALMAKNYQVIVASAGREAVQKIQASRPNLILLDAMLPEVHGFTICKTLKESQKYKDIPVIIITAVFTGWRFMMDVKEHYGANEVIAKPFKIGELLATVKRLLDESESRADSPAHRDMELTRKAEELLKSGMEAFQSGKINEAADLFRKGIEIDQLHPVLHYSLGKCAESNHDPFSAIASIEHAIELDPYFFAAVKDLGVLYQKNGFKRKAIEMWERAIQICQDPLVKDKIKQNLMRLL